MDQEFELSILDAGDSARAVVVARRGYDMAIESLSGLELKEFAAFHQRLSDSAAGREDRKPSEQELTDFGERLFALVVRDSIHKIYSKLPAAHARIMIYSNRADLQAIPWEFLREPGSGPDPNADRSVVRIIPTIDVPPPERQDFGKEVRMLFVYAEPVRDGPVDWRTIKTSIEARFRKRLPENFVLDVVEAATAQSFGDALSAKSYDILHMVCHGEIRAGGVGGVLLQGTNGGRSEFVESSRLTMMLRGRQLRLVVLSACNTSAGDFGREYAVVARTLVEAGIPAVVANQFEISNTSAASFADGFYEELLKSGDVDLATTRGRVMMAWGRTPSNGVANIDWGIPTLYRHLGGALAFKA